MNNFITGDGTSNKPFNARVRHIVRLLIKNPRFSAEDIKRQLKSQSPGIQGLRAPHIERGALAETLKFRVDLKALRGGSSRGTCFVRVKLKKKNEAAFLQFEQNISTISGIIEWDLIAGDDDYMIRIVGPGEQDLPIKIVVTLGEMENVEKAIIDSSIMILRSGIVDNFEPDHFFKILDDDEL